MDRPICYPIKKQNEDPEVESFGTRDFVVPLFYIFIDLNVYGSR